MKTKNQPSYIVIKLLSCILFISFISANSLKAQSLYKLSNATENSVKVLGSSNVHDWTMAAQNPVCEAEFSVVAGDVKTIKSLNFSVDAKALKSEHSSMDDRTYKTIKADEFPKIVFKLTSATVTQGAKDKFTISATGNLTIAGNVAVAVNETNNLSTATNDLVVVGGSLTKTGTGTLKVTNLGPTLNIGDSFTLFNKPVTGGANLAVSGAGVIWTNKLAIDGSIAVLAFATAPVVTSGGVSVLPNGNVALTATGLVGLPYTLLGSTNLLTPRASWQVITSGTVTTSPFTVTDTTASGSAQKFYIFRTP